MGTLKTECTKRAQIYELLGADKESRPLIFTNAGRHWREYLSGDKDTFHSYFAQEYQSLKVPFEWSIEEYIQEDSFLWERVMRYLFFNDNGDVDPTVEVEEAYVSLATVIGDILLPFILKVQAGSSPSYHAIYFRRMGNKDYISSSNRVRRAERRTENNPVLASIKLALMDRYPELIVHCVGIKACDDTSVSKVKDLDSVKDDCFHSFGEWEGDPDGLMTHIEESVKRVKELTDCQSCRYRNLYCNCIRKLTVDHGALKTVKEKTLTVEQQTAVSEPGTVLLSACPGSGKTTVLVERVNRILKKGVRAKQILV